jgi:hypothetical protein
MKDQFKSLEGGLTQARVYSFEIEKKNLYFLLSLDSNHTKKCGKRIQALRLAVILNY